MAVANYPTEGNVFNGAGRAETKDAADPPIILIGKSLGRLREHVWQLQLRIEALEKEIGELKKAK